MSKRIMTVVAVLVLGSLLLAACGVPNLGTAIDALRSRNETVRAAAAGAVAQATPAAPAAAVPASEAVAALQGTLEQIYQRVNPSVVNIQVVQAGLRQGQMPGVPFNFPQDSLPQRGVGSGFVWDEAGHIVTNYHVVDSADTIQVTFSDGTTLDGQVVGTDPDSDLAVVKVDAPAGTLHPVQMGDSAGVRVGQLAIAIGNPFGLQGTMTAGIISARGRSLPSGADIVAGPTYTIPDVIQTDAPINPGNSGGVLVNDQGQVIGVTSAIESPVQANAGVGFAIPAAIVQQVVPALIENGRYEHAWLGISGTTLTTGLAEAMSLDAGQRGVLVVEVTPGGPAEKAGLQGSDRQATVDGQQTVVGGDVIVAIDGQPVNEFGDLVAYLAGQTQVGQEVTLTLLRGGNRQDVKVTLGSRPQQTVPAAPSGETAQPGVRLGILGIALTPQIAAAMDLPGDQAGVLVQQVEQGSPADRAGLRGSFRPVDAGGQRVLIGGDVITAANGQAIASVEDLRAWLQTAEAGQTASLTLLRDGQETTVDVVLEAGPTPAP